MKKSIFISSVIVVLLTACYKVPITDRRQVNLLPEYLLMDMSLTNYNQFLSEHDVVDQGKFKSQVKNVGNKMSKAIETYLKKHGHGKRVKNYQWEFNLVNDKLVMCFLM